MLPHWNEALDSSVRVCAQFVSCGKVLNYVDRSTVLMKLVYNYTCIEKFDKKTPKCIIRSQCCKDACAVCMM